MPTRSAPAHPAATVVVLREEAEGIAVLLLRRNAELAFHGGAWGSLSCEDTPVRPE